MAQDPSPASANRANLATISVPVTHADRWRREHPKGGGRPLAVRSRPAERIERTAPRPPGLGLESMKPEHFAILIK